MLSEYFVLTNDNNTDDGIIAAVSTTGAAAGGGRGKLKEFRVDDIVEANFKGLGTWLQGQITIARGDNTYAIQYDNG